MKTILHILLGTERGGCEHDALCLIQEASQCQHHVFVLNGVGPMSATFETAGATIDHAGPIIGKSRSVISVVRQMMQDVKADGVIVWHGMVVLPEILHALHDFKGNVLVHGGNPAHSLSRWVDWRYWLHEKRLGPRCEATYVCCTQYVADSFERSHYLRRFPREVVFNGVKPLTVPPHQPREIPPGAPFTIGMTARLDYIKDHATLLRAFELVHREWPTARLVLAGDGDRRCELEQLALDLGVADYVRILGMVCDVYAVMHNWDIFAYATTVREGLGNALTEAMMLGLPCVATAVGPICEVAGDPPAIALSQVGDARGLADSIVHFAAHREERRTFSQAARSRAQSEFSGDSFARRHLLFLEGKDNLL